MSDAQDPAQPAPYAMQQGVASRPRLPESTPVYTTLIWVLAALPIAGALLNLVYRPEYRYEVVNGVRTIDPLSVFTPTYFGILALGLLLYGLQVVFSWLDRRELMRRGVERPFHWAWTFLAAPIYIIGRSVIVYGVARPRGLGPIWLWIATTVVNVVVVVSTTLATMSAL